MNSGSQRLKEIVEQTSNEHKEDIAREVKTHGQVRPAAYQTSSRTHKSDSKIRFPSEAYRHGYSAIDWGTGCSQSLPADRSSSV